ncbi:MAG: ATP-grasp domain-containing protein [Clostridiales bacterium]|nr:ATP-grasp domain-containing protein [Clostridiales bacterium]
MSKSRIETKYSGIRVLLIEGRARQIMPLMKSLHAFGCHITTYNSTKLDMGYASRYPDKKLLRYCDAKDEEGTYKAIRKELMTKLYDLVIPLNDFVAIILSKHKEELKNYVSIAVNDWDVFQYASDKLKTMKICMENDIPCPQTYIADEALGNLSAMNLTYPVCIKPRTGFSAVGFRKIDKPEEIASIVKASVEKYGPCLIQEYIPQTDLQYKAELFVDRQGEIKSACVFAKVRWYPLEGGSSTLNVTVHRPDIVESCGQLLKALNWRGYADIDLIQDPRDNTAKVMEINPRITGSVKICYVAGVNFTEQILQDYLGEEVTTYMEYPEGQYLRYLLTDILWFLKSKDRFHCKPSWFDFRNSVDQIWSGDDPWPFFTYTIQGATKLSGDKKKRKL